MSEWKNNPASRQYVSFIKPKGGRKATAYFRDFIGAQEGVDAPGETRTLVKAFADFVKDQDLADDTASEKSGDLVAYDKIGAPVSLDELSALLDEEKPRSFADFIKAGDNGIAESFAPDKRTLTQYRRFNGRAEGMSISFEARLLGDKIKFDEAGDTLTLLGLPIQLTNQLKRAAT